MFSRQDGRQPLRGARRGWPGGTRCPGCSLAARLQCWRRPPICIGLACPVGTAPRHAGPARRAAAPGWRRWCAPGRGWRCGSPSCLPWGGHGAQPTESSATRQPCPAAARGSPAWVPSLQARPPGCWDRRYKQRARQWVDGVDGAGWLAVRQMRPLHLRGRLYQGQGPHSTHGLGWLRCAHSHAMACLPSPLLSHTLYQMRTSVSLWPPSGASTSTPATSATWDQSTSTAAAHAAQAGTQHRQAWAPATTPQLLPHATACHASKSTLHQSPLAGSEALRKHAARAAGSAGRAPASLRACATDE